MLNFLIIDDHPLTVSAYVSLLKQELNENIYIHTAHNGNDVLVKTKQLIENNETLDLAIIDYSIAESADKKIKNGMDVAHLLQQKFKKCKIVFLTMHNEPLLLHNLHLKFKPEGMISKNDIDSDSFSNIIKDIMTGNFYRSETMIASLAVLINKKMNFDEIDTQILLLLAKQVKSKDLPEYINLSQSALEKRKYKIKEQILGNKGSDKDLIAMAKAYNLL